MSADNLPIDIHSGKLLDWLVSRRHCGKEWQQNVLGIRAKINSAIQDMPEHQGIVTLLKGSYINYFHCVEIVNILKSTEADSRNFLGQYSSQRMKDWQEVIRLYEKDAIYLAEAAQIMHRLVQYEIPGLKKQITKCDTTETESLRKEQDAMKNSKEAERNFKEQCAKMGVEGVKIRSELLTLARDLPTFFDCLAKKCQSLRPAIDYYKNFLEFTSDGNVDVESLSMLEFVLEKGNVTCFQWKTGIVPTNIERPSFAVEEDNEQEEQEIDFGFDEEEAAIDFGEFETGDTQIQNTVASGHDALSVLENSETQTIFFRDLLELHSFLRGRMADLKGEQASDFLLAGATSHDSNKSPAALNAGSVGLNDVEKYEKLVKNIVNELTDENKKHLFKIRTNPRYLQVLVEDLEHKRLQTRKFVTLAQVLKERASEAVSERAKLHETLKQLVEAAKTLQKQTEAEVSKRYNGRKVNIMGAITAVH